MLRRPFAVFGSLKENPLRYRLEAIVGLLVKPGRGRKPASSPRYKEPAQANQGHFGLADIRERAAMICGTLDIQSAVDYGTAVSPEVPC